MTFLPGDQHPASLSPRRLHDTHEEEREINPSCECNYLVLLDLDEALDGSLIGRMMCPDCGTHWTRGPGHSGPAMLAPSLRSEATPSLWQQRRAGEQPGA